MESNSPAYILNNIIIKWSKQIHNINLSILKVCKARGGRDKAHDEDVHALS